MNYYFSVAYNHNHYNAINLASIAIVSEDGRQLAIHKITPKRVQKAIKKFCNDGTERKFYSYQSDFAFVALSNFFDSQLPENYPTYFRDLKFLEAYVSEKVGSDYSVIEDSGYPLFEKTPTLLEYAIWMKTLHQFLINFELNLQVKSIRKKIGLDV